MVNKIDSNSDILVEKIILMTTIQHPSKENLFINLIIFEDSYKHLYLLTFESNKASFSLNSSETQYFNQNDPSYIRNKTFNVGVFHDLIANEGGIFLKIFNLDYEPPKRMTKEEIEKELGYQIEIVE